ncbi:unnamed protein product [Porites lobata]|uniref:G-protein coupled receptors family 1 profile domain-containing protein n=1 Tax=Porites lobata TaxID=104759 RepID=A0ABN8RKT6_9CNID|nr:unnamed protein product [Porites lobata]
MFSSSECITWFAAFLGVAVAIVTVNLLSIILLIKNSNLRTRGMYLVINLTVVDILVGGHFTINLLLINTYIECKTVVIVRIPREGYMINWFLLYWFLLTSLTNMAVISLERMHATFRPFRHRVIKKWVYGVTISVVWVLAGMISTAISMLQLFGKEWSHTQFLWQSYCLLCLFVICACYASVIVKICCGARPQHRGAARRQRKLTVTLLIMTIVSLLLWIPYAIATFVFHTTDSIRSLSYTKIMRLNLSLLLLFYTNSFVNPVVYTIRMPEYRKALLLLFIRRQRQNAAVFHLQAR